MQANQGEQEGLRTGEIGGAAEMDAHVQHREAMPMPGQATPASKPIMKMMSRQSVLGRIPTTLQEADHHSMPCCDKRELKSSSGPVLPGLHCCLSLRFRPG